MFNILNIIEICNRKEPDRDDDMKCADWKRQPGVNRTLYTIQHSVVVELSVSKVPEQPNMLSHPLTILPCEAQTREVLPVSICKCKQSPPLTHLENQSISKEI